MFLSACGCSWLSVRELCPNTSRGEFLGMLWGSVWWQSLLPACQVITGAEKNIELGCGKYSELKEWGAPGLEALRNEVCKVSVQLEEILSVCLSVCLTPRSGTNPCQGGCGGTVPGSRAVTLLSHLHSPGRVLLLALLLCPPLPIPALAPQLCWLSHGLGCACEFEH